MNILVTNEFVDKETGERRKPGAVLEVSAARAERLISRGLAKAVSETEAEPETTQEQTGSLADLTMAELRLRAEAAGISLPPRARKADIVAALEAAGNTGE